MATETTPGTGGPLSGLRVIEIGSIGPGPHAAMILSDLGADVVRVTRVGYRPSPDPMQRGRRWVELDLQSADGVAAVRELIRVADVLIEGFRPGVMERLGLGPDEVSADNPGLVYARMTGWGQSGPMADRAGHDINYIALAGALDAITPPGEQPRPPANLVGDFGGGSLFLVVGVLSALLERVISGRGQVVDAAMLDGSGILLQMQWTAKASPAVGPLLDAISQGRTPYYRTYRCSDGRYLSVGAIEPKFYREFVIGLGLDPAELPEQNDHTHWAELTERFAGIVATRTMNEWEQAFAGVDACVAPVLTLEESARHPQQSQRDAVITVDGVAQAAPAPRFSRSQPSVPSADAPSASTPADVVAQWSATDRAPLRSTATVG
ncbi:CaiB/BaiF CoA-transferase family protein [Williamsia sp. CHRR-6]|uniref:CaiB/BaiF CoA transferase family protein n=1 Tax=Williamsia sp. CHRR-6 TaxID=2835871 RepID=UPI001BDAB252|nr:CaiB/BaiF CoA-transferase family protein [Williamsia sp. CHRR-6]MBT0566841.1 CoA transferase [Williamsia sp. CHRR-6]